ncbi:MAG TPA: hypothetical protein VF791_18020 [Pyrinomonadaceae bacterium]
MNNKLRQYVRRIMLEKGLTVMAVAEGSDGQLTTDLLDDIRQARAANLSSSEVEGLAKGLGQPVDEVRAAITE